MSSTDSMADFTDRVHAPALPDWVGQSRVFRPGVRTLQPGTERYLVRGGTVAVFNLSAGDDLRIIDLEGRQACEIIAFGSNAQSDPGLIGTKSVGPPAGIQAILNSGASGVHKVTEGLAQRGLNIVDALAARVLGGDSRARDEVTFTAQSDVVCVVGAIGGPMLIDAHDAPTDLELFITRSQIADKPDIILPDPLADARLEFRIDKATAQSYEVKAGEFIQVIDVQGRQCSDFQAFPIDQLEKGIERCIDPTTTRTLMAHGYPHPGLHAKYYDQDMRPLVELLQDNCMRHDAFGLACTAKYYDDMGYPGHVNCSDNFNASLQPFDIAARKGWMAMNFFYNTGVDDANQFALDEPWSRPGDYVLMQALTDMVCVSSACPCDIDAANGWDPTDIHIRVYGPGESFKKSIGFRKSPDADVEMTKETGFHARTSLLTRDFAEYNGYWLANHYNNHGAIAEYWACREKAIIMDLSALRKFEVTGPDAETLLQYTMTRNIRKLAVGQVVYTAMCYDTGTMIDDGTVFRLGDDNFRWIGGSDYGGEWLREQAERLGLEVWVRSSTDQQHNVSVQGPASREIMKQVIWTPPAQPSMDELEWFRFSIARIGDFDGIPVLVSRTGYTGELGYEIFCHPNHAAEVWDAVWQAGEPHGIAPLGLEGLDMLRIESGLIFAGYEFDDQTDPFEAGIGFTVPLKSKTEDFIGREALLKRKENPQRRLVGLELIGQETAVHGDCVHVGRLQCGVVTSGMRSPILKKNIAMCRMALEYCEEGTEVEIGKLDGHQKRIPARVIKFPFYDPDKSRPRS